MESILKARNMVKRCGRVTALDICDLGLMPRKIPAVIGHNGAGKSTLIKAPSRALASDDGDVYLNRRDRAHLNALIKARDADIKAVYQVLTMAPALSIAHSMPHVFEVVDRIHVYRLDGRERVTDPDKYCMSEVVVQATFVIEPPQVRQAA